MHAMRQRHLPKPKVLIGSFVSDRLNCFEAELEAQGAKQENAPRSGKEVFQEPTITE